MSETTQWISGCVTAVLLIAIMVGGAVSCTMNDERQKTARIDAACSGDLNEGSRSAACTLALTRQNR